MGKTKFAVGEIVKIEDRNSFFYVYDYVVGVTYPYHLLSIQTGYLYSARAKNIQAILDIESIMFSTILRKNGINIAKQITMLDQQQSKHYYWSPLLISRNYNVL